MSLCQTENTSCGACCGLFNIDYPYSEIRKTLEARTKYFKNNVVYAKKETVISFREIFEEKENLFPKKDPTIYNCPFLGYINEENKRIGCMIHPVNTGDPKSQNFSFYGASICQSYDCKNKERKNQQLWEEYLNNLKLDSIEYSNIAGDHILITRIEEYFTECAITIIDMFNSYSSLVKKILEKRNSNYITSFEIDMDSNSSNSKFQLLVDYLKLSATDELFIELKNNSLDAK